MEVSMKEVLRRAGWGCLAGALFATTVQAGTIVGTSLIPNDATADATTGLSTGSTYTHLLDWSSNLGANVATVNGVVFDEGVFSVPGSYSISATHNAASNNNTGVPSGSGVHNLLQDFRHTGGGGTSTARFEGLTIGAIYQARFYYRQWNASNDRTHEITFDEGAGVPGSITLNPDAANEARFVSYEYTAVDDGTGSAEPLQVSFAPTGGNDGADSWHFYGFTNEMTGLAGEEPIPGLSTTGVDDNGDPLAVDPAVLDPHYQIITNPDGAGTDAHTHNDSVFPIVSGPWLPNDSDSQWIAPRYESSGAAAGTYVYRTTFDLTGFDPETARLLGTWATDNEGTEIRLNGTSIPVAESWFDEFTSFTVPIGSPFESGLNTLDFVLTNQDVGFTGLHVGSLSGMAVPIPEPGSVALLALAVAFVCRRK